MSALNAEHRQFLQDHAIPADLAADLGVRSVETVDALPEEFAHYRARAVPGLVFEWRSPTGGVTVPQYRPDVPIMLDGERRKYLFPAGSPVVLWQLRDAGNGPVALVEGTKQALAALAYAPPDWAVYGMSGAWNGTQDDLSVFTDRDVYVILDADWQTKRHVYDAAVRQKDALEVYDARPAFVRIPAGGDTGLDDYLAQTANPEMRKRVFRNLVEKKSTADLGKPPAKKRENPYFGEGGLLQRKVANALLNAQPAALTREDRIAVYQNGVYEVRGLAFISAAEQLLGDDFRATHLSTVELTVTSTLYTQGKVLPTHTTEPLLNVLNGMVDLRTGELQPHDPKHLSTVQIPIVWDPDATAPNYEAWLREQIPDQADDLEEVTSTMLDPSRTPTKAVFLFGPARSGKSTFLRLMVAMIGPDNCSAVGLHKLVSDRFAAANVYGKALNAANEISSTHIEDLSIFKQMTGQDPVTGDRKFGKQFTFVNAALFAFTANTLPTVSESSRAYSERIKPFKFGRSFAGNENPQIEEAMMAELPGILVRWVKAYQRYRERGHFAETDATVRREFEIRSDRVRQFIEEACEIHAAAASGTQIEDSQGTGKRDLYRAFSEWLTTTGGAAMGEKTFLDRLENVPGVTAVRLGRTRRAGFNVTVRPADRWGDRDPGDSGDLRPTSPLTCRVHSSEEPEREPEGIGLGASRPQVSGVSADPWDPPGDGTDRGPESGPDRVNAGEAGATLPPGFGAVFGGLERHSEKPYRTPQWPAPWWEFGEDGMPTRGDAA
jgi:putative DNA primase/helicase